MTNASESPVRNLSSQEGNSFTLLNRRLFGVAIALAVAPIWFCPTLPMTDMPQHAAQIAALQQIWAGNEEFVTAFRVSWFTPYLLGYLLLYAASIAAPIDVATQIVVSLTIITIPLSTGYLLRAAGADERWKWLAIPCSYGFALYWGFLSFMVAVPFGLLFIAHSIRFSRAPTVSGGIGIACFAVLLFFCHVIVLGFASLSALGHVFGRRLQSPKQLVLNALPFTVPLPLIAVWMASTYSVEPLAHSNQYAYGSLRGHLLLLLVEPAGRDSLEPIVCFMVVAAILLLPWIAGSRLSRRPERVLPFILGLSAFLLAPHYVFGTAYFFQRLGIFLVPLWLLVWDPAAKQRSPKVEWLAMAVVLIWGFLNAGRFAAFARETESFEHVMAAIPDGARVASMVFDKSSPLFAGPVYMHFPAWHQARKFGIVDFNFAEFYSQPARFADRSRPRVTELISWYPTEFLWKENGGDQYDYFVVKANGDISGAIFKAQLSRVRLVAQSEWWWLYRNEARFAASTNAE